MKKHLKKFSIYFITIILVAGSLLMTYEYIPKSMESLDKQLRDYMFVVRGTEEPSGNVVIVDLDDKSLNKIGQWPWSRDTLSDLLINLTNAGAGIITFDIVFSEEDGSSPKKFIEKFNIKTDLDLPDYDTIFAQTVAQTPTILGYQFYMTSKGHQDTKSPDLEAMFLERGMDENNKNSIPQAFGTILNIPIVQDNSYSSGFFNNLADDSGIIRSVPLLIRYDDQLYSSLALETIRAISGTKKVIVEYNDEGVETVSVGDFVIPTNRNGKLIVNFRGEGKTFDYISASDILENNFKPEDVEGKVVLIGTSAAGLMDLRATAFDSVYPGVEVHANVIDNILTDEYIAKTPELNTVDLLHIIILVFLTILIIAYLPLIFAVPLVIGMLAADLYVIYYILFKGTVLFLVKGVILSILFPILAVLLSLISAMTLNYFLETRQTQAIKGKFASKVSKEVMESLLANPDDDSFSAMSKEITVFFSDVRNFTNISEAMPNANTLIEFLNEYMDPMTDIIIKEHGTVDKFIGDAIMAYWNAPGNVPNHAQRALVATMEQLHMLDDLNAKIKADPRFEAVCAMSAKNGVEPIEIGIGLNTGIAVAGEMGSTQRSDYTIIGDPVNLGARLESLCKYYNSLCNISSFTKEQLTGKFIFRFLDLVTVKGKSEPIEIWQVVDYDRDKIEEETAHKLYKVSRARLDEELGLYHRAIELYKEANFKEALKIFENVEKWDDKTNKNVYKMYIERCEHYIDEPPLDFNGVFAHTTKG